MCALVIGIWTSLREKYINTRDWWIKITDEGKRSVALIILLMRILGFWESTSEFGKFWSKFVRSFIVTLIGIAWYVTHQELYYSRNSIELITLAIHHPIILWTETSKLILFIIKWDEVMKLNKLIEDEFWKKTYYGDERLIMKKCDAFCFRSICLNLFTSLGTATHHILMPLISFMTGDIDQREFPYPMRFIKFLYLSPFYEIFYAVQVTGTLTGAQFVCTFLSYPLVINVFTAAQFEILHQRLRMLCDRIDDSNILINLQPQREALAGLRECIDMHKKLMNQVKDIDKLYSMVLLGQVIGSVGQICFAGAQIILIKTSVLRKISTTEFFISSLLQFFYYCYSANVVYENSEEVAQAILSTAWENIIDRRTQREFAQLMMIMAIRAQRPCNLSVGKLYALRLATFVSVMSTSVSYFMVLRNFIK